MHAAAGRDAAIDVTLGRTSPGGNVVTIDTKLVLESTILGGFQQTEGLKINLYVGGSSM